MLKYSQMLMSSPIPELTLVVPVLNEASTIKPLVERINTALNDRSISYEIYFIDDHSTDGTKDIITGLQETYPIQIFQKMGKSGKARSLLEGFSYVHSKYIALIDGDLQYPPEAVPEMLNLITSGEADVVVSNRRTAETSKLRRFLSNGYRIVFGKWLWGFDVDVQSGLKVFRSEVISRLSLDPKPWTFDLEFLVQARSAGYKIGSVDITFKNRSHGQTKVDTIRTIIELGFETISLRLQPSRYIPFSLANREQGSGFHFKGKSYVTHNQLPYAETAVRRFTNRQIVILLSLTTLTIWALITHTHTTLEVIIGVMTILYFSDLMLNLVLVCRSYFKFQPDKINDNLLQIKRDWPKYTVFCPLYKEQSILPQFIKAMEAIDYPKDKLEVMLLLEADDNGTIAVAQSMGLPEYFKIVVVPDSMPKTKPKACNYGLRLAEGKYAVIYDAEDIPDPLQLKKAVLSFEGSDFKVGCVQAKLNYYNWSQNTLTRLFTLEYSLWFDLILPGLQSIKAPIPLGGTSNHFRVRDLMRFGGWDPFNVTEDADLGIRLSKAGYTTLILDSVTMEEANSQYKNWVRQRSRWIKGYIQTYFVHTRKMQQKQSRRDFLIFQLVIGGKVLFSLINPLLWLTTIVYFVFRADVGHYIHSLYSAPIFYLALTSLIVGNFLYIYIYMMAAAKRNHSELIITALLVPFYWLMISRATLKAIHEFIVKPFHWQKTTHGLHLLHSNQPFITSNPHSESENT
jgi:cellulose synthase/poly-beta-1,6-N-acetylglucosamine synthase-like glycosyltransferase